MHIICLPAPSPPPPKLHNFCFSFLLGITAVSRETENNFFAKFFFWGGGGANNVHYGRCASGVLQEQIHVIIIAYILGVQNNFI